MASPSYSVTFHAKVSGSASTGSAGDGLIPSSAGSDFVLASSANRGTRRSTGIALGSYSPSQNVEIQQHGQVDFNTFNLGSASASWVRMSSAGRPERCTPSGSDDIIGYCDADGTLHLACGFLTAALVNGSPLAASAISALAIDWSLASVFTKTLGVGGNVFTFSNQTSGQVIMVRLTSAGGGSTVTWPTVKWAGGTPPTQSTPSKTDVYTFVHDGTNIYGSVIQDLS